MCGIAGFIDTARSYSRERLKAVGLAMGDQIRHRGPDSFGCWVQEDAGLSLSHRRLAIIDLSETGAQPMTSHGGRYVIAFNGEIYNFEELRAWLGAPGDGWRGHSDTEVLLECFAVHGVAATLQRAAGMFALALWDKRDRTLTLARDRAGEKPLYYGFVGRSFVFASELKALKVHPEWQGRLNEAVLPAYLRFGYVPSPASIFTGISKLPPGTFLTFDADKEDRSPVPETFWTWPKPAPGVRSPEEIVDELDAALKRSVRSMMMADVPLGSFLSGGIDSSVVTAIMQSISDQPVRTFSIGFDVEALNEAPFAANIARHLGTDHTEMYVSAAQALETVPGLGAIYDEPFADSSQIPTLLLSQLVRSHVTVALSGDAGDELFGGYIRYGLLGGLDRAIGWCPLPLRRCLSAAIGHIPTGLVKSVAKPFAAGTSIRFDERQISRLGRMTSLPGRHLYRDMMSQIAEPGRLSSIEEPATLFDREHLWREIRPAGAWAAYVDALTYLPDDILTKVDRASMSASLEVRVPMLHPEVIALAAETSWATKTRGGTSKWPLHQLLSRYVPAELYERPKMGFGVPLGSWLRGELKAWAGDILSARTPLLEGLLEEDAVDHLWREHITGERDNSAGLWTLIMLKDWALRQDNERLTSHSVATGTAG
jgi:asparagine synthase (glutamine-hydrolysing)